MTQAPLINLPNYKIIRELGIGGQARVYLAEQESMQRKVAIKTLLPAVAEDAKFTERFLREGHLVGTLSHPHIVPVYDSGEKDGIFYMIMEYFPGGGLKQWIDTGMTIEEVLRVLTQLASALHYAHERGVIHRDIKPDNVMFREDHSAVLMDFGIARRQDGDSQLTRVGQLLGTPKYMSPEQFLGRKVDGRTDLYALGIMFFQMLTKRLPYEDTDIVSLAMKHATDPIPKLPKEFGNYQKIFERMVAKEPEKRFQTGMEIARLFQDILSGKEDAAGIDSAAALDLKSVIQVESETEARHGPGYISREHISFIQDLYPLLEPDWETRLTQIFRQLDADKKKYVYTSLLNPKGIYLDKKTKRFVFFGSSGIAELLKNNTLTNRGLQVLAQKLEKAKQVLRKTRDIMAFSDLVESSLSLLDHFDCQDNRIAQKERSLLRKAYLNDLVLVIRGAEFELPSSQRRLTVEEVTTYILQAFIKQQLMGYRFRTTSFGTLEENPDKFLREVVAVQARIRQCDIIETEKYLFLVGPVRDISQNPYSIRRFVYEESLSQGTYIYFNAVAVPREAVADPETQQHISWTISRIITLEKQLSPGIIDIIHAMEQAHRKHLRPILEGSLTADGTHIEKAIEDRLLHYERELTTEILVKLTAAIGEMAKTPDDFDYLFGNVRRILIDIACDIRDFNAQASTSWSQGAEALDLKLVSYLRLLDKRKDALFVVKNPDDPQQEDPLSDPMSPSEEFRRILKEFQPQLEELNEKLKESIRRKEKQSGALAKWLEKILGLDKKRVTPEMVEQQIDNVKQRCLVHLIKVCKRYPKVSVYLEFEDLVPIDENQRHYALPSGLAGLSRLPALIVLSEDKSALNIGTINKQLDFDVLTTYPRKNES